MNMLDEEERFHATRESFARLSDLECAAVGRMRSTVDDIGVAAMLKSLDRDQQHASIAKLVQFGLVAEGEK